MPEMRTTERAKNEDAHRLSLFPPHMDGYRIFSVISEVRKQVDNASNKQ